MKKEGIILIDKPPGLTSYDVVGFIKRRLKVKKVGHAGTLDPIATGLLIVLVGGYTKYFDRFSGYEKEYEATLTLGANTDTGDSQGKVLQQFPLAGLCDDRIKNVFREFIGPIEQIPPMVSALRYKGKRLYELAREGIEVPRKARPVTITRLDVTRVELPQIDFVVRCSKGTYIRVLGYDIGARLQVGGHISRIRRTQIGPYSIAQAFPFSALKDVNEIDERYFWTEASAAALP
jgi:tRNA pseudouridine55 synthase